MNIMDILYVPMGYLLSYCYDLIRNYGMAIILFTILMKVLILPLGIKQKKSTLRQIQMRPKEDAIRKQHKNDKQKLNEEIMALYQKEGYNPMGGCLPVLIQFPIIIALYQVIRNPLTYILHIGREALVKIGDALSAAGIDLAASKIFVNGKILDQIKFYNEILKHRDAVSDQSLLTGFKMIDFNFFGLDLSATPQFGHFNVLWIIPLLAGVAALLSGIYTQKTMPMSPDAQGASATKSMIYFMPVMSLVICFQMPAGVGLYWAVSSALGILQEYLLNLKYKPLEVLKKAQEEAAVSNNQKKKKKKEAIKAATEAVKEEQEEELRQLPKGSKVVLPKGKKVSFRFEDDPEVIALIKEHNAAVDRENINEVNEND